MSSPHEIDLEREDIDIPDLDSGLSKETEKAWDWKTDLDKDVAEKPEVEEVTKKKTKREERIMSAETEEHNMEVMTPAHLWDLGATKFRFHIETLSEALQIMEQMQVYFEDLEEEFAERLQDIKTLADKATDAQIKFLIRLYEEAEEDYDKEEIAELSKLDISERIQEMLDDQKAHKARRPARKKTRKTGGSRSRRSYDDEEEERPRRKKKSKKRRSSNRRKTSSKGSKKYDNDEEGSRTDKQAVLVEKLCDEADEDIWPDDVPGDLDDWSFQQATDFISETIGNQ